MRRTMLTAAAALVAVALPVAMTTSVSAQMNPVMGGGAKSGGGAVRSGPVGGGGAFRGGMVGGGGGAFRGGGIGAGPGIGMNPRFGGGPNLGTGIGPRTAWTGSRSGWVGPGNGWNGGYRHRNRFIGPGIGLGIGTGLLLGGAYAAQPYYYDDPYYYGAPYDDGYVESVIPAPGVADGDAYCRQRYRSYDPRSGTYLNNDGNRYPCP